MFARAARAGQRLWRLTQGPIARSSIALLALRLVNIGLMFGVSVGLARVLGAEHYGVFAFGFALVTIVEIVVRLGFAEYLTKQIPVYDVQGRPDLRAGLVRRAYQLTVLAALLAIALWAAGWALKPPVLEPRLWQAGLVAMLALPFFALTQLAAGEFRGHDRAALGRVPNGLVYPAAFLALATAGWLGLPPERQTGINALYAFAAANAVAALAVLVLRRRHALGRAGAAAAVQTRAWLGEALPYLMVSALIVMLLQLDVLLLGALKGPELTGLYQPATRIAMLTSFILTVINQPLAPRVSRLFKEGQRAPLQRILHMASLTATLSALPVVLVLGLAAPHVLSLFGAEFTAASTALLILIAGQLVNAVTGPCNLLLSMTGHQATTARIMAGAVGVNLALNLALIPRFGIEGAAVATMLSTLTYCSISTWAGWRLTGLKATFLLGR